MNIPNQDKDIYNIVEKKAVDNTVVENLLPEPEKPKLPDIVPDEAEVDVNADNLDEIVDEVGAAEKEQPQEQVAEGVPEKTADLLSDKKQEVKEDTQKTIKEEVKPVATANNGPWQIQLLVSKDKNNVEKKWQEWSAKYNLLKTYPHEVQSVNLGVQGTVYRLRAGSFSTKDQAQSACATLKSQGLDCIAKER